MSNLIAVLATSTVPVFGSEAVTVHAAAALQTGEIVWMPAGDHHINAATPSGPGFSGRVRVDENGFRAVVASYDRSCAAGYKPWIDFNHDDAEAAGWVEGFSWDPTRGIIAKVSWTPAGKQALEEKRFRSFSPAFMVEKNSGALRGIYERHAAGGLVNAPAFGAAMPALVAARLAGADSATTAPVGSTGNQADSTITMNREQMLALLASLGVKHDANATDEQLVNLLAAYKPQEPAPAGVPTDDNKTNPALAKMQADIDAIHARQAEMAKKDAEQIVQAAVDRGALKADDAAGRAFWVDSVLQDKEKASTVLASLPGKATAVPVVIPVQAGSSGITAQDQPLEVLRVMAKEKDHRRQAAMFRDVRPIFARGENVGAVLAANSLGSLAGTIVLNRSLDLLKVELPMLNGITTDFSAEAIKQGQQVTTRLRTVPTVTDYDPDTGYATSDVGTSDVSISINKHKAVQIAFGQSEIASTGRDLIGEQAEGISYALAKAFMADLMALPNNTDHGTNYKTVKALASLTRADLVAMEKAMSKRGVSKSRQLWVNPDVYEKFSNDTTLVNLAVYQKPEMITGSSLPPIAGFNVFRAVDLPATAFGSGALQGFGFAPDAFALATRLPNDYTKAVGVDGGGALEVISHESGISFQVVKFVDHILGKSYWRAALQYGVANGQKASCQVLTTL